MHAVCGKECKKKKSLTSRPSLLPSVQLWVTVLRLLVRHTNTDGNQMVGRDTKNDLLAGRRYGRVLLSVKLLNHTCCYDDNEEMLYPIFNPFCGLSWK